MKSIIISILVCFFVVASGFQSFGAEMTQEQKEVWATIEASWEAYKNGDIESALAGCHDKYLNLQSDNPTPINIDQIRKRDEAWLTGDYKLTSFKLKPITISIINGVAIVYYWNKWGADSGFSRKGRTMSTLIKQNKKWIFIGTMGASCEKPAPCPYGF